MRRSLLSGLFVLFLAGCGDPMDRLPKLSDVDLAEKTAVVEAFPDAVEIDENVGFFSRLMRKRTLENKAEIAASEPEDVKMPSEDQPDISNATPVIDAENVELAVVTPPVKTAGLFRFLKAKSKQATEASIKTASLGPLKMNPDVALAAPATEINTDIATKEDIKPKRRVFGPRRKVSKLTGPDAREVSFGTQLPFGELARVCGTSRGALGTEVSKFPERKPKYRLYDSAAGTISPHNFYVTGFPDGCARQFTAALAMFGSPEMHEQLRYGRPSKTQPYSATDKAYEKVKSRVCRVGRQKPCGDKIRLLEENTAFISIYNSFDGNSSWTNLLLHKGKVMASARVGG